MSFGPSAVEGEAQQYRQQFGAAIPGVMNQGMDWMNKGFSQLDGVNGQLGNYISGIGKDPMSTGIQSYLSDVMSGKTRAEMGQSFNANAAQAQSAQGSAFDLGMRGQGIANRFGSDLGGLALQQKNMQSVADRLSSTTENPFAQLTKGAMEDAAFQNAQGRSQLQSQLASQGLGAGSGTGAAALAALQFNTNKSVADAGRQNAVQGAQFQQQGLGMAGNLYQQMGALDLQRASTAGQLGLQGYQADLQNAGRLDAVNMQNAQMQNQTNNANAGLVTQAALQNAQLQTQASMGNAASQNQWMQAALQGQMGLLQNQTSQQLGAYGLMSQNAGQYLNAGSNMWGQGYGAQQNYMGGLNQMAQANAQGRSEFWGGLLQGGLGLAGTLLTGLPMFGGGKK
jgi:hypothetical protein